MRALGLFAVITKRGGKRLPAFLQAERHHCRVAAEGCSSRGTVEIVGHHDARSGGLSDMNVAVYAARQDVPSGRVDYPRRVAHIATDLHDPAVANPDVGLENVRGSGDCAIGDN